MHAVRLHEFGPPENLIFEAVEDPRPVSGQVRIRVAAAGVHLIDTAIRAGRQLGGAPLPALPSIPGREVAGTVDAIGADVDQEWLGQRVVTHLGAAPHGGGYAELALAAWQNLDRIPDAVAQEVAVAMIGTGRTALAILELAQVRSDDVVLVTGAAGGLGTLLVQAALRHGATVLGLASGQEKVDAVRRLGAAFALDSSQADWSQLARAALGDMRVTLALDGVGGSLGRHAFELVGVGGRLIMFGFSSGAPTPLSTGDLFARGVTVSAAVGARIQSRPGGLRRLEAQALTEASAGTLVPRVQCFPLAQAAEAHSAIERRATIGKVVLVP